MPPPATQKRQGGLLVFLLAFIGGAYYYLRKRSVSESLGSDPERSRATRHRVPLSVRIDQDQLRRALAEEEEKERDAMLGRGVTPPDDVSASLVDAAATGRVDARATTPLQ